MKKQHVINILLEKGFTYNVKNKEDYDDDSETESDRSTDLNNSKQTEVAEEEEEDNYEQERNEYYLDLDGSEKSYYQIDE